jgi:indolepyruvate ferredoxin oxidoreductase
LNEELAVSAIRGTQQLAWFGQSRFEGIYGLWYGKGVGVDRACESLKLGNLEGAAATGGFLAVAGDDHGAKSSDSAHQSEHTLIAALMPILYPATLDEIIEFGLFGWAMSRFSGCYVGLKCITETLDVSGSIDLPDAFRRYTTPADVLIPPGGLNLRANQPALVEEEWAVNHRLPAATAFARANGIDRTIVDGARRTLAIVAAGKAYLDVRQALADLGLDEAACRQLGIRLYKPGLIWPLDRDGLVRFAAGSQAVLVVEEKRPVLEDQIARHLYGLAAERRPALAGKLDLRGAPLLPSVGELAVVQVRRAIKTLLDQLNVSADELSHRHAALEALESHVAQQGGGRARPAYFCSGCPHNTSTRLPEGSFALGGIGCHGLVFTVMPERNTMPPTPMGAEGMLWTSVGHFVDTPHVFANMGDGTYSHSGILAIRAAVAAKATITYKLLYNDAVAMTGGQPVEGCTTPMDMVRQVLAEGVKPVRLVTDHPEEYRGSALPPSVSVHHRDELDRIQRELRTTPGVTAIVYVQTCAAEKRRRRKRGLLPDPDQRVFINAGVCEGCGDCTTQSNCLSVLPLDTEFGRKRRIDQSNCNKDYSCLKGFCPSFVTVTGARIAVSAASHNERLTALLATLPTPTLASLAADGYNILVGGIGGTGVLTIGALLGMAAHLDGKAARILDTIGMAQKGGAVTSHIRIAQSPGQIHASRLGAGMADVLIACDLVVSSSAAVLRTVKPGRTVAVLNDDVAPTSEFQSNQQADFSPAALRAAIVAAIAGPAPLELAASHLATELTGDSIGTNVLMLGFAAQQGLLPVGVAALEQAIRLNGNQVEQNLRTFALGRLAAHAPEALARELPGSVATPPLATLDEVLASRIRLLTDYQDAGYAQRYREFIANVDTRVRARQLPGSAAFVRQVALTLARLMAYKDEYEVARLHTDARFLQALRAQFAGDFRLSFDLAPPLLPGRDASGRARKRVFGQWILPLFRLLRAMRRLRGTAFDPFGYTAERRAERRLIVEYRALIERLSRELTASNLMTAIDIAGAAGDIAGYGPIKVAAMKHYAARCARLQQELATGTA